MKTTYLNGGQTPAERIARFEQRLNKFRDELQSLKTPRNAMNGFKNFLETNVMRRRN